MFWSGVSWSSTYLNFSLFPLSFSYLSVTFPSVLNQNGRSNTGGEGVPSGFEGIAELVGCRTEVHDWPHRAIHYIDSAILVSR